MCLYTVIPFPQRDCRWNEGQGGRERERNRQKLHTKEPQLGSHFFDLSIFRVGLICLLCAF